MSVTEIIESERAGLRHLRAISEKAQSNGEIQRLVAQAALEAGERLAQLQELLHYREEKSHENENE